MQAFYKESRIKNSLFLNKIRLKASYKLLKTLNKQIKLKDKRINYLKAVLIKTD